MDWTYITCLVSNVCFVCACTTPRTASRARGKAGVVQYQFQVISFTVEFLNVCAWQLDIDIKCQCTRPCARCFPSCREEPCLCCVFVGNGKMKKCLLARNRQGMPATPIGVVKVINVHRNCIVCIPDQLVCNWYEPYTPSSSEFLIPPVTRQGLPPGQLPFGVLFGLNCIIILHLLLCCKLGNPSKLPGAYVSKSNTVSSVEPGLHEQFVEASGRCETEFMGQSSHSIGPVLVL